MSIANKIRRKWNSRFYKLKYKRETAKKWKKRDLHRWVKKHRKLISMMHKRYAKTLKTNKEPYCPRCEGRDWKCGQSIDENDTYDYMNCKFCGFSYSPSHS